MTEPTKPTGIVERLRETRHELTIALQPRRSEVERTVCVNRAISKIDALLALLSGRVANQTIGGE